MEKRRHIKRISPRKSAYFLTFLSTLAILLFSITFSIKQVVFNPNKMNQAFSQTNISQVVADQINHNIIKSVTLPLNGLKIITPNMVKEDFNEIVNNGYQKSELYISERTLNRQVKQSLANNGIKSSILDMLIDQVSPTVTDKFNVEIDTADNRQYLRNLLLARQVNQILLIFSLILLGIVIILTLWQRVFLTVGGYGCLFSGIIGILAMFLFQKYVNRGHFFSTSIWQQLMQKLHSFTLSQWQLLILIELVVGLLMILCDMLKRRWLS